MRVDQIIGIDAPQRVSRGFADAQTHHDSTGRIVTDVEVIFIPVVQGDWLRFFFLIMRFRICHRGR